jgi:hypothetical protein
MRLHSWLGRPKRGPQRGPTRRRAHPTLSVEVLDDRVVPAFLAPVNYATGSIPVVVVTADFNGDGIRDLAVANAGSNDVNILLGNGDGTFQAAQTLFVNSAPAVAGDFNADGKMDLALTGYNPGTQGFWGNYAYYPGTPPTTEVTVLLGHGDGSFQPVSSVFTGATRPLAVAEGDFNADGKMDLAVTGFTPGSSPRWDYYYYDPGTPTTSEVTVLLGNGDGTVEASSSNDLGGDYVPAIATGDFNGDGTPDLAWVDSDTNEVGVLLGTGDGSFVPADQSFATAYGPNAIAVADLNRDGKPDLVTAGDSGLASVLLGNGDGTFQAAQNDLLGAYASGLAVADVNGDGKPDLLTANFGDNSVGVLPGNGDGSFRTAQFYAAGTNPIAITAGDFTGDGAPDLAVANYSGGVSVLLNTGDWRAFQVSGIPSPATAGQAQTFTVTALDDSGNPLPSYTGTVRFSSTDPQAVLPADYTFTAADHGVHTFSATLKTMGTHAISARDATTGIMGIESRITVNAAAASTMSVSGFPSTTTAGTYGYVTVTLKDPYGNLASGYRGTVHFSSTDARASLSGNYTFTVADFGVHTFPASLRTAGTQSITVTDIVTTSLTGKDAGITVIPAQASRFLISYPANVGAGVAFSLTVTVTDAYGNGVTGYTGTIHFSSTDSLARLPVNYTFTAADKGVHTFTGLTLQTKGKQSITIMDVFFGFSDSIIVNVIPGKGK